MPIDPTKIEAIMTAKKISRAELARRAEIPPPHVTRLLSGERPDPQLSTAERIATALGSPLAKILTDRA